MGSLRKDFDTLGHTCSVLALSLLLPSTLGQPGRYHTRQAWEEQLRRKALSGGLSWLRGLSSLEYAYN